MSMACARCLLELSPGAAHINPESCVDALRHALDNALNCRECGIPVLMPLHAGCMARAAAKGGAALGAQVAERKLRDAITNFMNPTAESEDSDEEPRSRGKRWKP